MAFFAGWFFDGFKDGILPPTYASDEEVIKLITTAGIDIPEGARNLSYFGIGFTDTEVWISMEVPLEARDTLMGKWLNQTSGHLRKIGESDMEQYGSSSEFCRRTFGNLDLDRFDLSKWVPVGYVNDAPGKPQHAFIFDTKSNKVLLVYISGN